MEEAAPQQPLPQPSEFPSLETSNRPRLRDVSPTDESHSSGHSSAPSCHTKSSPNATAHVASSCGCTATAHKGPRGSRDYPQLTTPGPSPLLGMPPSLTRYFQSPERTSAVAPSPTDHSTSSLADGRYAIMADFPTTLADRIKSRARRSSAIGIVGPDSPVLTEGSKRKRTTANASGSVAKRTRLLLPLKDGRDADVIASCDSSVRNVLDSAPSDGPQAGRTGDKSPSGGVPAASSTPSSSLRRHRSHFSPSATESTLTNAAHALSDSLPSPTSLGLVHGPRNFHDPMIDGQFVVEMQKVLKLWSSANRGKQAQQARRIDRLLDAALPPRPGEAHFATDAEAVQLVAPGSFFDGPIFTQGQQPLPLQTAAQFLSEYYDDTAYVDVQDPALRNSPHVKRVTIGKVKQRFLQPLRQGEISGPWNLLEVATHVDEGIRPNFLNGEDCRLLTKIKLPSSITSAHRRHFVPGWKEVERWALLAQAGALTEPHQDSHGYSTFITCNDGQIGFGWLSHPTHTERTAWQTSPLTFTSGRWRYVVLKPGHTVFFPSGTVHFVFRLPSVGNTLAFGGHVLRCSTLVHWISSLLAEKRCKNITNEDLSVSAPAQLDAVEKFVKQARRQGAHAEGKWGGSTAIDDFLRLKADFLQGC